MSILHQLRIDKEFAYKIVHLNTLNISPSVFNVQKIVANVMFLVAKIVTLAMKVLMENAYKYIIHCAQMLLIIVYNVILLMIGNAKLVLHSIHYMDNNAIYVRKIKLYFKENVFFVVLIKNLLITNV